MKLPLVSSGAAWGLSCSGLACFSHAFVWNCRDAFQVFRSGLPRSILGRTLRQLPKLVWSSWLSPQSLSRCGSYSRPGIGVKNAQSESRSGPCKARQKWDSPDSFCVFVSGRFVRSWWSRRTSSVGFSGHITPATWHVRTWLPLSQSCVDISVGRNPMVRVFLRQSAVSDRLYLAEDVDRSELHQCRQAHNAPTWGCPKWSVPWVYHGVPLNHQFW